MILAWTITFAIVAALVALCIFRWQHVGWIAGILLAVALPTCMYDTYLKNPFQLAWLCNYTAFLSIVLLIRFNRLIYDFVFFYAWIASLTPLFVPQNGFLPQESLFMIAYLLKHALPAIICLYLMRVKKCKISHKAFQRAFAGLLTYIVIIFVYNIVFDQNILQLMEPTVEILHYFGKWPIYNLVNLFLAFFFFNLLFHICKRLNLIKNQEKEIESKKD